MEWGQEHGCLVNGPSAQAEADLQEPGRRVAQEPGRRVAQELHYQPLLADDPALYA